MQALVSIVIKIVGDAGLDVNQIDTERIKSHLNKRYGLERRATTDAVKTAALIALGYHPATLPSRKQLTKGGLAALTGTCGRETPLPYPFIWGYLTRLSAYAATRDYGPDCRGWSGWPHGRAGAEYLRHCRHLPHSAPLAGAQRVALQQALAHKQDYEFQAHGVELNHRYTSAAVVPDGLPPAPSPLDPELYYLPTTSPGARLPHAWVQQQNQALSTLDLVGQGRFTVLTGIGGEAWLAAAASEPTLDCRWPHTSSGRAPR